MGTISTGSQRPHVVAIVGPTAAGKTAVSIELAGRIGGEIVSADARQVYRYLDVGTAKPTADERRRVRHHLVDFLDLREEYSAGRYGEDARSAIEDVLARGSLPILVGGSGLYVRAALDGLFEGPQADARVRDRFEKLWKEKGEDGLRAALRIVDQESADQIELGKPRRLIRALEVFELTGLSLSEHHRRQVRARLYDVSWIGIAPPREELYRRIDLRVHAMIENDLVGEVQGILDRGYERTLNSLNTVGYREVFDFIDGSINERDMIRSIQTHTRQYAKRQLTWFNADQRIHWMDVRSRPDPIMLSADIHSLLEVRKSR